MANIDLVQHLTLLCLLFNTIYFTKISRIIFVSLKECIILHFACIIIQGKANEKSFRLYLVHGEIREMRGGKGKEKRGFLVINFGL